VKEASNKPQTGKTQIKPSLASALLIGVVIGLPLVAAVYVMNKVRKG